MSLFSYNHHTTNDQASQEENEINELLNADLFENFVERRKERERYEHQVLPWLTSGQATSWHDCSSVIWVKDNGTVSALNSCKNRVCTICNWRNARKKFSIMKQIFEIVDEQVHMEYMLLTCTIKNVKAENLSGTISDMMHAVNRMQSSRQWKKRVKAYVRNMEITYNKKRNDFHPHIHYIIGVPTDYFNNPDLYWKTYHWRKLWETAMRIDYNSQFDIEPIKRGPDLEHSLCEISKYAVKMTSAVKEKSPEIVHQLMIAMKRRRLIAYGGIFKDAFKAIRADRKNGADNDGRPEGTPYIYSEFDKKYVKHTALIHT